MSTSASGLVLRFVLLVAGAAAPACQATPAATAPAPGVPASTARPPGSPAPVARSGPRLLTAGAARMLLLTDPTVDPHRPRLPARLNKPDARYVGLYRICVDPRGQIESVKVNRSTGDAELDDAWMAVIRSWRYRPLEMSGRKVPFCYVSTVEAGAS
jgi:TonB family protein